MFDAHRSLPDHNGGGGVLAVAADYVLVGKTSQVLGESRSDRTPFPPDKGYCSSYGHEYRLGNVGVIVRERALAARCSSARNPAWYDMAHRCGTARCRLDVASILVNYLNN